MLLTKIFIHILIIVTLIFSTLINAMGNIKTLTGEIGFIGAIIYAPCSFNNEDTVNYYQFSCLDKQNNVNKLNFNPLELQTEHLHLTDNKGNIRFKWINEDQQRVLLTVNYQ